jgi:hypothetical protein
MLRTTNLALREQLKQYQCSTSMDLDSPLSKVLKDLKQMADEMPKSAPERDSILGIVRALTTTKVYVPAVDFHSGIDSELGDFLQGMLQGDAGGCGGSCSGSKQPSPKSPDLIGKSAVSLEVVGGGVKETFPADPEDQLVTAIVAEAEQALVTWDWSAIEFNKLTSSRPLYYLGLTAFRQLGIEAKFGIEHATLEKFLTRIELAYHPTIPYHNSVQFVKKSHTCQSHCHHH